MRIPELTKIKHISWVYSSLISFLMIIIISGFIYIFQRSLVEDKVFDIRNRLIEIFDENEDIADAISAKYTTLVQNKNCIKPYVFNERGIYGFNYSDGTANNNYKGTLLSLYPLSKEGECLNQSVSFVLSSLINSDLITRNGFRYVLSEKNKIIYTFKSLRIENFNIQESEMFYDIHNFVETDPEYYKRKLTRNIQAKGTVATPFYIDKLNGKRAYSVVSFIYDLNHSSRPIAYLLYDHSSDELFETINEFVHGTEWIKVNITEKSTGNTTCIINCKLIINKPAEDLSESLSGRYELTVHFNMIESIITTLTFKISLILTFIHSFLLMSFFKSKAIQNQKNNIIDHLTELYNRKVIPLILNDITNKSHIVIIDCNRFKAINDHYGHNVGDQILIYISEMIKKEIGKNDIAIRYGGDEFMIIIDSDEAEKVTMIVEGIGQNIRGKEFSFENEILNTSISYGIAVYNGNLQLAIHEADQKMYAMKNGLHTFPPPKTP